VPYLIILQCVYTLYNQPRGAISNSYVNDTSLQKVIPQNATSSTKSGYFKSNNIALIILELESFLLVGTFFSNKKQKKLLQNETH
jgi:hypothetical protein